MPTTDDAARWRTRIAAILDVVRASAAGGPAPRGRPFFGLDEWSPTPLASIDDLATRGIFRKYEHVLDLGSRLGASTRYLTARLGCTATATAGSEAEAAAARTLTARAGLDWQVRHVATTAERLPFADAAFTHVWIVDALPDLGAAATVLAEAFRVLRPGGHFAVQDVVRRHEDAPADERPDAATRVRNLRDAGFVEVVRRDVPADVVRASTDTDAARARLARRLGPDDAFVAAREALAEGIADGRFALVQLTARRP